MRLTLAFLVGIGVPTATWAEDDAKTDPAKVFAGLDKNKDGKLTGDELSSRFVKRALRVGDADKNGELSKDEFVAAMKKEEPKARITNQPRPGRDRVDVNQLFTRFDKNNDGKLTLKELPDQFQNRMKPIFERLGVEAITKEQFAKLRRGQRQPRPGAGNAGGFFDRIDTNKDGKITAADGKDNERVARAVKQILERVGKDAVTKEDFLKIGRAQPRPNPAGGGRNADAFFNRLDTNNDGKISMADAKDNDRAARMIQGILQRAGKGKDGAITKEEFAKIARAQPRPAPGDARPGVRTRGIALIRVLDANKDGKISKEELAKAAEKFAELDTNKDGSIDVREIFGARPGQAAGGAFGARGAEGFAKRFFDRYDADKDGNLTEKEVPDRMWRTFSAADADKDGKISLKELTERYRNRVRPGAARPGARPGARPARPRPAID